MRSSTSIQHWTSLPSKYQRESFRLRSKGLALSASSADGGGGRDLSGVPDSES